MSACATCGSERQAELESVALAALRGRKSWRQVAREAGE